MKQYLLSMYQPDGHPPPSVDLVPDHGRSGVIKEELEAIRGVRVHQWVGAGQHRPPCSDSRTVTYSRTDGPFVGGQGASGRILGDSTPQTSTPPSSGANRITRTTTLPIEVRPFRREAQDLTQACRPTSLRRRSNVYFRSEQGRAVRRPGPCILGDIDIAEEAVQDAFVRCRANGGPPLGCPEPRWMIITTARNRAIDRLRREASREDRHAQAALLHAGEEM